MRVRFVATIAGFTSHPTAPRLRRAGRGTVPVSLLVRRSLGVVAWLVISGGLPANAFAQETSIEQLVATALKRSPEIRAARTTIASAGGEVTQASLRPNPTFIATQMLMTGSQHQSLFEVEWPPKSGRLQSFPEVDRAAWFTVEEAREKMLPGQRPFIDRLLERLGEWPA